MWLQRWFVGGRTLDRSTCDIPSLSHRGDPYLTAVQLRNALRSGELSSVEIVQALHARRCHRASLNAYVEEFREQALLQAQDADMAQPMATIWGLFTVYRYR